MEATISVELHDGSLPALREIARTDCGAIVDFRGNVRDEENGATISGLEYEAYRAMAVGEIERIIHEVLAVHRCSEVHVAHRLGFVPVGETSITVRIAAPHRGEAISFLEQFMNRLKQDVPIWKQTSPSSAPQS